MPVRKIKANYCSLTGQFSSQKLGRLIQWESALERDLYHLLEFDRAASAFEEQPLTIKYGNRKYTPDTLVTFSGISEVFPKLSNQTVLIEVKYREDLKKQWPKNHQKFRSAIQFCKGEGIRFKFLTEKEIRTSTLDNIKFIDHFSRKESDLENEYREVLVDMVENLKITTPNELLIACFNSEIQRKEAIPIIWRLLGDESVGFDIHKPLNMNSDLWAKK